MQAPWPAGFQAGAIAGWVGWLGGLMLASCIWGSSLRGDGCDLRAIALGALSAAVGVSLVGSSTQRSSTNASAPVVPESLDPQARKLQIALIDVPMAVVGAVIGWAAWNGERGPMSAALPLVVVSIGAGFAIGFRHGTARAFWIAAAVAACIARALQGDGSDCIPDPLFPIASTLPLLVGFVIGAPAVVSVERGAGQRERVWGGTFE